ncbi:MAG: serine hydrolase domain-containing protein [Propionibacteriaceae bacterium]
MTAPMVETVLADVGLAARAVHGLASGPAGVVVGVSTDAGTRIEAVGVANAAGRALLPTTRFDVASVSKVVATTTTIHRLASLGLLRLDEPVSSFFPGTACAPGTSISTLMRHRAGLWEWQPLYLAQTSDGAPEDPFTALTTLPLRYPPDDRRAYSDLGFILLGRVVEEVTGMRLDRAVAELVTGPIGLSETWYGPVTGDVAASAMGDGIEQEMIRTGVPYPVLYPREEVAWRSYELVGEVNDGNCYRAFGGVSGHAGIFSTAADLLRLGRSLASAGERDDLWRSDITSQIFAEGPDAGQALGWRTMPVQLGGERRTMVWHPGFTGAGIGLVPGTGVAITLLSNRLMSAEPLPTALLWATALETLGLAYDPTDEGTRP